MQDTDDAEVWEQWDIKYRDVVIVDGSGEIVGAFKLSSNSLAQEEHFLSLTGMILEASAFPDSDGDRVSDLWEITHYGNLECHAG